LSGETPPLLPLISDYVAHYAKLDPDRELLAFGDLRMTYAEVESEIDRVARALLASGIERGDRVAYFGTSRPEFWIHFLATTSVGAIWMGLNPKYRIDELRYVIGDAAPCRIFAQRDVLGEDCSELLETLAGESESITELVTLGGTTATSTSFESFLERAGDLGDDVLRARRASVDPMDAAFLVYTSGSTGKPKGALLTHHGENFCNVVSVERKGLMERRIVCCLPINHVGAIGDICARVTMGGGTIFFQEAFDPLAQMKAIELEQLNAWGGVPTMFQLCVRHPQFDEVDLSSVELLAWGGAAMPIELLRVLRKKTGASLCTTGYGSTETTGGVTFTDLRDSDAVQAETIGTPDPRLPIRIWHAEGRPSEVGEEGEIQVGGDFVMKGYWQRPEATAEALPEDGWMRTGDVAVQRPDGNLVIVGRLSQMYKSGGYNVYPREVELCLEAHPSVAMAAVVSVPDDVYQEVGHAYVAAPGSETPSAEELRGFVKEHLANYKVPKRIVILDALPMLPVGKVDKVALKERALAELGG
jgi:fatty-acyl-CoA synthase